ncbi:MAG: tRNA (N(6)-L-threonylcarbamoyladenosine(37)-C(2))-methylthiotransferase MtaB [Erysipelotrichaceae bacterium]|nr:tRNA (N(6)-L-threonylcarbamoyladenosine(37)-C(2))-methylthiotransferase MtaB [Erysipelotrichaceae bacterium]
MKTYAMMVLGCKVNDYEATYVREKLNRSYQEVDFKEKADIYIIFTCCVTNTAESKTRKFLHDARRNNPDAYIVAVGCMSQIKGDSSDFDDADLLIGSDQKDKMIDLILNETKGSRVHEKISTEFEELFVESYPKKSRAFLKIQDGCNQFCSYCIIPYARGRQRCARHEDVLKQAEILARTNKEIVLTGIHTGRYDDGEYDLHHLLKDLVQIEDLHTIRISSIEMNEVTDEIIGLMKENNKIAHHLHVPVQALNDTILSKMNRPYTLEEYIERISFIHEQIPGISIGTDLIVGFPYETDEIFEEYLDALKKIRFAFVHVFPYARKKGTVADTFDHQIDNHKKKERVRQIIDLQQKLTKEHKKTFIGKTVKVLIERNDEDCSYGYSREYIYTKVPGIYPVGEIINVTIESAENEVIAYVAE